MRKLLILTATVAVLGGGLSACGGGGYHFAGGGYDAYYDDFYGPYVDGYWGDDGVFMYRHERGGAFTRDEGHHFHRSAANGFHGVHAGHAPASGQHRPG